jgi:hypothetical protein
MPKIIGCILEMIISVDGISLFGQSRTGYRYRDVFSLATPRRNNYICGVHMPLQCCDGA